MAESPKPDAPAQPARRGFLKQAAAIVLGGAGLIPPVAAGFATFIDPLRRKSSVGAFLFVASLNALPADGVPRRFPVIAEKSDIWNRFPHVPIGAVYLRRTAEQKVEALNVICPHAGCPVEFRASTGGFRCPCHDSTFHLDGTLADGRSPSPRGLDPLEVEVRNGHEIWVKFQNFRAATPQRIPL